MLKGRSRSITLVASGAARSCRHASGSARQTFRGEAEAVLRDLRLFRLRQRSEEQGDQTRLSERNRRLYNSDKELPYRTYLSRSDHHGERSGRDSRAPLEPMRVACRCPSISFAFSHRSGRIATRRTRPVPKTTNPRSRPRGRTRKSSTNSFYAFSNRSTFSRASRRSTSIKSSSCRYGRVALMARGRRTCHCSL